MIDRARKHLICVEWFNLEPNFDGKVFLNHRFDGVVIDTWPDGENYWFLIEDATGELHRLPYDRVRIINTQAHIDRRNAAT